MAVEIALLRYYLLTLRLDTPFSAFTQPHHRCRTQLLLISVIDYDY